MSKVEIICGDCLEEMPKLAQRGVVGNCLFADPPYTSPVVTSFGRKTARNLADLSVQETYMKLFRSSVEGVLRADAPLFMFCDDDYYPTIFRAFYAWHGHQLLVWDKGRIGMGAPFRKRHELLFYANRESVDYQRTDGITHYPSVLAYAPVPTDERIHGAQKPVELIADLLLGFTQPDDLVIDPYAGSGSVGVACIITGRNYIGIELNEETCDLARARLSKAQGMSAADIPRRVRPGAPTPLFDTPECGAG